MGIARPGIPMPPDGTVGPYDRRSLVGAPAFYNAGEHITTVEIAFNTDLSSDPASDTDWTDISSEVRHKAGININRGRSRDLGSFQAANASFEVDNRDGDFTPNNSASSYGATAIRPMRHVRVRMFYANATTLAVTDACRFRGVITGWQPHFPGKGHDAVVKVNAVDYFAVLAQRSLSLETGEVVETSLDADHHFKLDETSGTTATDSGSTPIDGTYAGSYTLDDHSFYAGAPDRKAPQFDGTNSEVQFAANAEWGQTGAVSISAWVRSDGVDGPGSLYSDTIAEVADPADYHTAIAWAVGVNVNGELRVRHGTFGSTISSIAGGDPNLEDGSDYHILVTRSAAGVWNAYINGTLTANSPADGSSATPGSGTQLVIGGEGHLGGSSQWWDGHIGDVAIWNRELSAGEAGSVYAAEPLERSSELTSARVTAILDTLGHPSTLRSIQTGQSTMQANTITDAQGALSALNDAADVEAGQLFIDCDGRVVFEDRYYRSEQDSVGTFGNGVGELPFHNLQPDYQVERIANEVTATRSQPEGGAAPTPQVVSSSASQTSYGRRALSFNGLDFEDDTAAGTFAQAMLNRFKDPDLVVQSFQVEPHADPDTLYPVVLAADISTRLDVNWSPDGGADITQDSFIESINETIYEDRYVATWRLAPASHQAIWVLDKSELDVSTRLAW